MSIEVTVEYAHREWNYYDNVVHIRNYQQLQAKVAELEEEIERLRADNIAFARNLKGKSATTGATYEHICTQLAAAQEEIRRLEKIVLSAQNAAIENGAALKSTQDQLAKAEQRVAEWQPISTAPITCNSLLIRRNGEVCIANWGDYDEVNQPKFTHWMPLPKAPANGASS